MMMARARARRSYDIKSIIAPFPPECQIYAQIAGVFQADGQHAVLVPARATDSQGRRGLPDGAARWTPAGVPAGGAPAHRRPAGGAMVSKGGHGGCRR